MASQQKNTYVLSLDLATKLHQIRESTIKKIKKLHQTSFLNIFVLICIHTKEYCGIFLIYVYDF